MRNKTKEVETNEELTEQPEPTIPVWPESYETYLGDGIYIENVN